MMKQRGYLKRRGDSFSVRVMIPRDIRPSYGTQKEITRALGTTDPSEAEVLMHAALGEIRAEFKRRRERNTPTAEDVARAADTVYRLALEDDLRNRDTALNETAYEAERNRLYRTLPDGTELEEALSDLRLRQHDPKRAARWRDGWELALRQHIAVGETVLVDHFAEWFIEQEGYQFDKGSLPYRQFCRELIKAQLRAIEKMKDRDNGIFHDDPPATPTAASIRSFASVAAVTAKDPKDSIEHRLGLFTKENPRRARPGTLAQIQTVTALFSQFVGPPAHVSQITRANVADWKRALRSWPDRAAQRKEFAGLTFNEVIAKNETLKIDVISEKTINRYLSDFSGFCKWLRRDGKLSENPVTEQWILVDKTKKDRASFKIPHLKKLFSSPLFTGCESSAKDFEVGSLKIRDHRYWLPLIALYTGARITEIAQLSVDDLRQKNGIWYFDVTDRPDTDVKKSLKTDNAKRKVPVHEALIDLGLLAHREAVKKGGHRRLFPEIVPDKRGEVGARPSRWFGRYMDRIGLKSKSLVFHSFRYSFADAMRRAGYMNAQFAPLLGHGPATITSEYGDERELTLEQRLEMVRKVSYPGLDLSHLLPETERAVA